jgi:hypothetical protein
MYLGRDVLTSPGGTLYPIRWAPRGYAAGQHQGKFDDRDKAAIHKAFRAKVKAATSAPALADHQDWSGLQLIVDAIFAAATQTTRAVRNLSSNV